MNKLILLNTVNQLRNVNMPQCHSDISFVGYVHHSTVMFIELCLLLAKTTFLRFHRNVPSLSLRIQGRVGDSQKTLNLTNHLLHPSQFVTVAEVRYSLCHLQGGHGTGKTGNLVLTFSRQVKHREYCSGIGKILLTQEKYFKNEFVFLCM